MGGLLGEPKGMLAPPLSNYWGGGGGGGGGGGLAGPPLPTPMGYRHILEIINIIFH